MRLRSQLRALPVLVTLGALSRAAGAQTAPVSPSAALPPRTVAANSLPFVDLIELGSGWSGRPSSLWNIGGQIGLFVAGRLRLAARLALPTSSNADVYYFNANLPELGDGYQGQQAKPFSALYGVTAGYVAVSTPSFALSPGLAFSRSNVSDYGSMLALAVPVEWTTSGGVRLGLELDMGRVLGGSYRFDCSPSSALGSSCPNGTEYRADRPSGAALWLQFSVGYAFGHS